MKSPRNSRTTVAVLDAAIDALTWDEAVQRIARWSAGRESRYVCACNVHSVVTAGNDSRFLEAVNSADMATPDGMPIAWALKRLGFPNQSRINGPDLMWRLLARAQADRQPVFFYGSSPNTLSHLQPRVSAAFPELQIAGALSPPFRALSDEEDRSIVSTINESGATIVFVGLGCPKQEKWMADHRGRIQGVMLGVGAAFDYHAGILKRAPGWMQEFGLEWLYRFEQEPRRLWRRYLATNMVFAIRFARQLLFSTRPKRAQ